MGLEGRRTIAGSTATTARKGGGQVGGEADDGGIKDVNAPLEAVQQGNGSGRSGDDAVQGCCQNLCETMGGGDGQALVQCLRAEVGAEVGGEVGEGIQ